jgi:4Fe-4S ferredoxin
MSARQVIRIDHHRCEGAAACVPVCPTSALVVRPLTDVERKALPLRARLKVWVHGGKQAFLPDPEACVACGKCVAVCPERALTLSSIP